MKTKMITYTTKINGLNVNANYSEENIVDIFLPLLRHLTLIQQQKKRRVIAFLAAPPATGKSTLVAFLQSLSEINEDLEPIDSLGMDGFHHYQDYLYTHFYQDEDGKRQPLVNIKGAPCTFDVPKLEKNMIALQENETATWPLYDRTLHNPIEHQVAVTRKIVLIEGNYLLLNQEPWNQLSQYADYTIYISAEKEQLVQRLIERKIKSGNSYQEAKDFVYKSDLENVKLCHSKTKSADLCLQMNQDETFTTCQNV